jgi:membrane glycosyltransferase
MMSAGDAVLSCWVSAGFCMALMGFVTLARGRDRFAITATAQRDEPLDPAARTAVVMPICNEEVARVFAGLRATYESLARTGELDRFDFYVLSDSNDPDARVAELDAWARLAREANASAASSIAGARIASSARAATSQISAGAGAASTATWSSSMRTA